MAVVSTSSALHLLLLVVATGEAATINITNRCSFTVWPPAVPTGGGVRLDPGKSWAMDVRAGATSGGHRIWPRTGCSFDDGNGNGACQTGDCGGVLSRTVSGQPPNTMAEFTIGQFQTDFFDISIVDGFNVPMDFLPVPTKGEGGCSRGARCAGNITSRCPSELTVPGGCKNACAGNRSSNCTNSGIFKQMCPEAYSDPHDDATFSCPTGTDYQVVFCPPINLAIPPEAVSPPRAYTHSRDNTSIADSYASTNWAKGGNP